MDEPVTPVVPELLFSEVANGALDHRINLLLTSFPRPALVIIEIDFAVWEPRSVTRKEFAAYLLSIDDETGQYLRPEAVRIKNRRTPKGAEGIARKALRINAEVPENPPVTHRHLVHFLTD